MVHLLFKYDETVDYPINLDVSQTIA
jgi:hypothetical protein